MRSVGRSVAGRSDVSDHFSAGYMRTFNQIIGVLVEMRIVVAIATRAVEFVDSVSTRSASEELTNSSVDHCEDGGTAGTHDVDRLVAMSIAQVVETVAQLRRLQVADRRADIGLARRRCRRFSN